MGLTKLPDAPKMLGVVMGVLKDEIERSRHEDDDFFYATKELLGMWRLTWKGVLGERFPDWCRIKVVKRLYDIAVHLESAAGNVSGIVEINKALELHFEFHTLRESERAFYLEDRIQWEIRRGNYIEAISLMEKRRSDFRGAQSVGVIRYFIFCLLVSLNGRSGDDAPEEDLAEIATYFWNWAWARSRKKPNSPVWEYVGSIVEAFGEYDESNCYDYWDEDDVTVKFVGGSRFDKLRNSRGFHSKMEHMRDRDNQSAPKTPSKVQ